MKISSIDSSDLGVPVLRLQFRFQQRASQTRALALAYACLCSAHLVTSGVSSLSQSWLHGCGLDGEVGECAAPAAVLQATWLAILAGLEEHRDVVA